MGVVFALVLVIGLLLYIRSLGQVKAAGGTDADLVATFDDEENPWVGRIRSHDDFGQLPPGCLELLGRVSADSEERVIGAVFTNHGRYKIGYLMATTHQLRWVQTGVDLVWFRIPWKDDDYFDYGLAMDRSGKVLSIGGSLFQVRGRGRAKRFIELFKLIQQALMWQNQREAQAAVELQAMAALGSTGASPTDTVGELHRLSELRDQGVLSEAEFSQAKQKLLAL